MKRSLFAVNRKLTNDEWELLKKWKAENPDLAWKCGDSREDGKIFRVYSRTHSNGERWISVEQFEKERQINIRVCKLAREKDRTSYNEKSKQRYANLSDSQKKNRFNSSAEWRRSNPSKVKEIVQRYKAKNPERLKQIYRSYIKRNIAAVSLKHANRRLKIKQSNRLSGEEKRKIEAIYKWRDILNTKHGKAIFHVDHIIPISRGGEHRADNLRVTTAQYNWVKNNKIACH